MIDETVRKIISRASKYPAIKRVGIFGSFARGNMSKTSDIDLLYDYDSEAEDGTDELLNYVEEINDALKSYLQVPKVDYVWYEGVLESRNKQFRDAVLDEVVWIYDGRHFEEV